MKEENKIELVDINEAFKEKFLSYAKKVIMDRSLPDINGTKPVHRRIVWGMEQLKLTSKGKPAKSARIVGDIMGKFHPHGDSSIYEAMVRLSSPHIMRYPLIIGQGNLGGIDGSGAAAMRYTEMKPSPYSELLVAGYKENAVDFMETFNEDGTVEPAILPGLFPNVLVNGNDGIAVGMAGAFLPHNLTEVINGILATLENPSITIEEIMEHIKGPDFPLGGTVINQKDILAAYKSGRSPVTIKVRGDYEIKGREIIFTSVPYGSNTEKIMAQIAKALDDNMLGKIKDILDETDSNPRIIFELFNVEDADAVLDWIFKKTDLQKGSGVNMNLVVGNGFKEEAPIIEIIKLYIFHQLEVIERVAQFRLEKAEARKHILDGLTIALANIDEVVKIIRASSNSAESKSLLVERYAFSDLQVKAVLDIKLSRLNNLEVEDVKKEIKDLDLTIATNKEILASETKQKEVLVDKLTDMRETYGDARRTKLENIEVRKTAAIKAEVPSTPVRVAFVEGTGGIKLVKQTLKDSILIDTKLNSTLVVFTDSGIAHKLKVGLITDNMQNVKKLLDLKSNEKVLHISSTDNVNDIVVLTTANGMVKKTKMSEFSTTRAVASIKLREGDSLVAVSSGDINFVTQLTSIDKELTFDISEVSATGRVGIGVKGIKLKEGELVTSAIFSKDLGLRTLSKRNQASK